VEVAVTNLGSPELHSRHSVMIEGGKYPRSKVMDQHVFDRYLMEGIITLTHHRAAEVLLGMAAKADMWARGVNMDGVYTGISKSKVPFGVVPFGNALRKIRNECGRSHYEITRAVILRNKDVRVLPKGINLFTDSMEYVNDNIIFFHRNPLRHLK
jgi:hypothetical protein